MPTPHTPHSPHSPLPTIPLQENKQPGSGRGDGAKDTLSVQLPSPFPQQQQPPRQWNVQLSEAQPGEGGKAAEAALRWVLQVFIADYSSSVVRPRHIGCSACVGRVDGTPTFPVSAENQLECRSIKLLSHDGCGIKSHQSKWRIFYVGQTCKNLPCSVFPFSNLSIFIC